MLEDTVKLFNVGPSLMRFNISAVECCNKGDFRTDKFSMKDNKEKQIP